MIEENQNILDAEEYLKKENEDNEFIRTLFLKRCNDTEEEDRKNIDYEYILDNIRRKFRWKSEEFIEKQSDGAIVCALGRKRINSLMMNVEELKKVINILERTAKSEIVSESNGLWKSNKNPFINKNFTIISLLLRKITIEFGQDENKIEDSNDCYYWFLNYFKLEHREMSWLFDIEWGKFKFEYYSPEKIKLHLIERLRILIYHGVPSEFNTGDGDKDWGNYDEYPLGYIDKDMATEGKNE